MDSRLLLFNFLGQAIEIIFLFLVFIFSRIWFGIEIIGIFGWIYPASVLFIFVTDFGVGIAHVKHFNESNDEEYRKECNGSLLILKIIQISIMTGILFGQAFFSDRLSDYRIETIIISIGLVMHQIYEQIVVILLQSEKKVVKIRLSRTVGTLFRFISLFIFYKLTIEGIFSLSFSTLIQSLILFCTAIYFFRRFSFKKPSRKILLKYLKFILPFIISTSSIILMQQIPPLLYSIINFDDVNLSTDLGNYSTAFQLFSLVLLFPPLVSQVLLPTFAKLQSGVNGGGETQRKILITHKYLSIIIIILVVFSFIFTDKIMTVLFVSENYQKAGLILNLLLLSKVFELYSIAYVTDLQAKQRVYYTEAMSFLNLVIYFGMILLFVSPIFLDFKIEGVAYAIAISSFIYWTIFDVITCIRYKYKFYWKVIPLLITLVAFLLLSNFVLRPYLGFVEGFLYIFIETCVAIVLFTVSFVGFKILNKNDLNLVKAVLKPKNLIKELKNQLKDDS